MGSLAAQAWKTAKDVPLSLSLPAVTAAAAYINGRYGVTSDLGYVGVTVRFATLCFLLERRDRVNLFYKLEELAQSAASAHRVFLVVPKDSVSPGSKTEWTYAEAYETVLKYAAWLSTRFGVKKGDIIALDCPNKPKFLWIWFAIWSLGAKPAFINTNLRGQGFVHCVRISTSRTLLLDSELSDQLLSETGIDLAEDGKGAGIQTIVLDDALDQQINAGSPYRAPDQVRSGAKASSPAFLIYTSGTTGLPKAAHVDWRKALSGASVWCPALDMKPTDRFFTALPLYHTTASCLGVCTALAAGCTLALAPKFSPRTFMQQAIETDATIVQYIGEMCRYLMATPPSPSDTAHNIRAAFGNGLRPDVWQKFKDRYGIGTVVEMYGATEGPGAMFIVNRNTFTNGALVRIGPVLRFLLAGRQNFIKHDVNTDQPVRSGDRCVLPELDEPGEMIYKLDPANTKELFAGYHGNEKATDSKLLRNVFNAGDIWYRSGDLLKRDRNHLVYFVDRIGDTFRWKGENVSTSEVSAALGGHEAVAEANVYGTQLPGHDGRAGSAALTLHSGHSMDDVTLRQSLAAHVRERLPRYALPIFLRLVKEAAMTGTFKQTKVGLKDQGVDPDKVGDDALYWLAPNSEEYQPFGQKEWNDLTGGRIKL